MYFIGIDVSKDRLDYVACDENVDFQIDVSQTKNDKKGISGMLKELKRQGINAENAWFCFEHTGHYSLLLSCLLDEEAYRFSMLPPVEVKKSLGLIRGKNDRVDAQRLAEYGATKKHKLKVTKLPSKKLQQLKQLLALRKQLVKSKSSYTNSGKTHQTVDKVVEVSKVVAITDKFVEDYKKAIKEVEREMKRIIKSDKKLRINYDLVTSVKGIGHVIATALLVHTQNFKSFGDPRKFLCYAGMAPFANSSGLWEGVARTSNFRHKYLKSLFSSGVNSAIQHDPELQAYYYRKLKEGKSKGKVINAVSCKLVYRAFAVIRRGTPFVQHGQV